MIGRVFLLSYAVFSTSLYYIYVHICDTYENLLGFPIRVVHILFYSMELHVVIFLIALPVKSRILKGSESF